MDQGPRRAGHTFPPQETVTKFAATLKQYGCHAVIGDRYAGSWPAVEFGKHGVSYRVSDKNRSELYAALEPRLNSGGVQLLDHQTLLSQLIGLLRKGEKVDHATGEHDDHANSCAGVVVAMTRGEALRLLNAAPPDARTEQQIHDDETKERATASVAMINESVKTQGYWWPN